MQLARQPKHDRVKFITPSPQVALHGVENTHAVHPPSVHDTESVALPAHAGPEHPTHSRFRLRLHVERQASSVNCHAVHDRFRSAKHEMFWNGEPTHDPTHPTHERLCLCVPVPHITEQLPVVIQAVHALSAPAEHGSP
jgi:hypothetical protein